MNQDVVKQLIRARTALILDQPFFGMLALRLKLVEKNEIKTLAVDGKHVFYNADFVKSLSPSLTKSALAHEVGHCIFDHLGRRGARNPRKWNCAGDYVINDTIQSAGFELGTSWLHNAAFAGMGADHVYSLLPDDEDGEGGGGDPLDEMIDATGSDVECNAVDWKIATLQAAAAAKAMGKLHASLSRFVDELTAVKVDWRERLRRFVTENSRDDYSWLRPNRHFIMQGLYLPSLYSENMGEIVVAIDTSGSIDQPTLNAFGAEIKAIVGGARPKKTTVIYCDAAVNHVDTFEPNDELHFDMHGGGGTNFCPPFEYVAENGLKPVCFVYLTDGYGPFPSAPEFPTLWCCTTEVVAPFGETVPIEV